MLLFVYKKAECVSRKSFLSCRRICKDQSFICPSKWLAFAEGLSCDAQFNNLTCICPESAIKSGKSQVERVSIKQSINTQKVQTRVMFLRVIAQSGSQPLPKSLGEVKRLTFF